MTVSGRAGTTPSPLRRRAPSSRSLLPLALLLRAIHARQKVLRLAAQAALRLVVPELPEERLGRQPVADREMTHPEIEQHLARPPVAWVLVEDRLVAVDRRLPGPSLLVERADLPLVIRQQIEAGVDLAARLGDEGAVGIGRLHLGEQVAVFGRDARQDLLQEIAGRVIVFLLHLVPRHLVDLRGRQGLLLLL